MGADITVAGLEAAVGDLLEAEASAVEGSSLLGVSDPEDDVVESLVVSNVLQYEEPRKGWLGKLFCFFFALHVWRISVAMNPDLGWGFESKMAVFAVTWACAVCVCVCDKELDHVHSLELLTNASLL